MESTHTSQSLGTLIPGHQELSLKRRVYIHLTKQWTCREIQLQRHSTLANKFCRSLSPSARLIPENPLPNCHSEIFPLLRISTGRCLQLACSLIITQCNLDYWASTNQCRLNLLLLAIRVLENLWRSCLSEIFPPLRISTGCCL